MTFKESIINYLQERAMSQETADTIYLQVYISCPLSMQERMERNVDTELPSVLTMLIGRTKRQAIKWIDENQPEALTRCLFE
jgi:hypothetical protein